MRRITQAVTGNILYADGLSCNRKTLARWMRGFHKGGGAWYPGKRKRFVVAHGRTHYCYGHCRMIYYGPVFSRAVE